MTRPAATTDLQAVLDAEVRRISTIRTQMLEAHPFWGYLLFQVKLVPALELGTFAATDCVHHIWYNPLHTRHLSAPQLGFVLAHEVCHQVLASEDRRRGRNHHLWNCATDYAINRIVATIPRPSGQPMYAKPEGGVPGLGEIRILDSDAYDGLIAETIYEGLASTALPSPGTVSLVLPARSAEEKPLRFPGVLDHHGGIDVHLPGDVPQKLRDELRERLAGAVETWRGSGERGHLPEECTRDVTFGRGHVPWQRIFRQHVGQALARDEYALTRPNRRYLDCDLVVPGLYSEGVGHVVVALDTSSSMTKDELRAVGAEIAELAHEADDVTLIVADDEVKEVVPRKELEAYLARGQIQGGGGTDHRPVFAYLRENGVVPDLFVGLTDLFSQFPERRPGFPVVWVVPPGHGTAPWGKVVEVR